MVKGSLSLVEDGTKSTCMGGSCALKVLAIVLGVVVIALVIALVVVGVRLGGQTSDGVARSKDGRQICMTPTCVGTSAYILDKMNQSVDPCQDMYLYACGGWLQKSRRPLDKNKWDTADELAAKNNQIFQEILESPGVDLQGRSSSAIAKVKALYRSCMNESNIKSQGVTRLLQMIDQMGSWTVSTTGLTKWVNTTWSLENSLVYLHQYDINPLFKLNVKKDFENSTKHVLFLSQSGVLLTFAMYNNSAYFTALLDTYVQLGQLLGGTQAHVRRKMTEVAEFEKRLAGIFEKPEDLINPASMNNKFSVKEFQNKIGQWMNVKNYLNKRFELRTFKDEDELVVATKFYFEKLKSIIDSTDKEVLANYMVLQLVIHSADYLPDTFSEASLGLQRAISGVGVLSPRHERCLLKTRTHMGFALSSLYVQGHFRADSKAKVVSTLDEIQKQFVANLDDVTWLDDVTRQRLVEKGNAITQNVGYPDWILDPVTLDGYYQAIEVKDGEFLYNFFNVSFSEVAKEMEKYGKPYDRSEWHKSPDEVNAYYDMYNNHIVVLAAILQPPYFTLSYPQSFIYGTIGMVLGHEITHGFDSTGRNFDKDGNLGNIWTEASAQGFGQNANCMVDQYSSYTVQGQNLRGTLNLGENIADNGGLKFSYMAYKTAVTSPEQALPGLELTDDQLFFLGFSQLWCGHYSPEYEITSIQTQRHTHNRYRVIGTVSNSQEFSRAFNCPSHSPMNPEKKCQVW
ncbi:endothelin-converting enzyme 1-like [Physella acuta]|uniref:endothelin-converting enzyme 1-like n=1 Tax=Physella acuta TaxID=109671 RepID=UPI0027DC8557|nr:endothelin-converting enzyme 1-like [Physella acuta]